MQSDYDVMCKLKENEFLLVRLELTLDDLRTAKHFNFMSSCYGRLMKPQAFQLPNRRKSQAQPFSLPLSPPDGSLLANLRQKLRQATPSHPGSFTLCLWCVLCAAMNSGGVFVGLPFI